MELYHQIGYSGLVITDHFYHDFFHKLSDLSWEQQVEHFMEGFRRAHVAGSKLGMDILFGIEVRFDGSNNDYLVYGIDQQFILEHPRFYELDLAKFRELIAGKGMLIYQAHPYRAGNNPADPTLLDGVEVFNGNGRHDSHCALAYEFAQQHDLKMIASSDFHEYEDLGAGGITISRRVTDTDALIESLSNNHIVDLIGLRGSYK